MLIDALIFATVTILFWTLFSIFLFIALWYLTKD